MRIGLLGGTFNPIHFGHLVLAEECRKEADLEKIIFIPSSIPPHKEQKIAGAEHRYNMVKRATRGNKDLIVSRVELDRKEISFTYKTIRYFKKKYVQSQVYFILGIDSVLEIHKWKKKNKILEFCPFIVATRPGYRIQEIPFAVRKIVKIIKIPKINISSSLIREKIKTGESIKNLVPLSVEKYIKKHKLYQQI